MALGIVCLLLVGIGLSRSQQMVSANNNILTLHSPPFSGTRRTVTVSSTSFLDDEAGITAYVNVSQTIRLDYVESAFRVVEIQTEDYLIGSVSVPGYDIEYDAHVYVHESGWLVAYYLPTDPVSKIFDWRDRRLSPTLLENVLIKVANEDGITLPEVSYYDFRYPNATHMLWVKKNSGTFQIDIPSSFEFYERSWVLGAYGYAGMNVSYVLDGDTLADFGGYGWQCKRGTLTEEQLRPDLMHTFEVSVDYADNFSALVLVYREPDETP